MKLAKTEGDEFVFQIGRREKTVLWEVLRLYPLIPASHHRIAKGDSDAEKEKQKLLEEAVAEQRAENKAQLRALLNEPQRIKEMPTGYHLHLNRPQIEWLLQVLNDIRVGSWLNLGSPDEKNGRPIELNEQTGQQVWIMEYCGYFQMTLLEALGL